MKKLSYVLLAFLFLSPLQVSQADPGAASPLGVYLNLLGPLPSSKAFELYQKRPKSEFSKLLFLMDRFRHSEAKLVYDGREFEPREALKTVKSYIAKHYDRKTPAKNWVHEHAYRAEGSGNIIYLKFEGEDKQVLRDVLVAELEKLEKLEPAL